MSELVEQRVALPDGEIRLLQPSDASELPDEGDVKWAAMVPYWSTLWRSGVALAREVAAAPRLRGRRVVELGCGLGAPSIAAARAGADVLATDSDPDALELVRQSAALNAVALETAVVEWRFPDELVERGPFDLALAADVLYDPAKVDQFLEILPRLGREAWMADPGRADADAFLERAAEHWSIETRTEGVVRIHRIRRA